MPSSWRNRLLFRHAMKEIGVETPARRTGAHARRGHPNRKDDRVPAIPLSVLHDGRCGRAASPGQTSKSSRSSSTAGSMSPVHKLLIEESVIGWKQFELEVTRDVADNFVVICSIENIDSHGRPHRRQHHGCAGVDASTEQGYQRDARRGAAHHQPRRNRTGGSRFQFCVDPKTGGMLVIDMKCASRALPRWLRRATGSPSRRIAADLPPRLPPRRFPRHHAADPGLV